MRTLAFLPLAKKISEVLRTSTILTPKVKNVDQKLKGLEVTESEDRS
jgi:hypothetical protein